MPKPILSLFDVRLKSPHKDVILIKGDENEVDFVPFEGTLKLSTSQDMHVKRISLNLIGEYNVEYVERGDDNMIKASYYDRLCVLKVDWGNLLTNDEGDIVFGNYGERFTKWSHIEKKRVKKDDKKKKQAHSQERPGFFRTKSSPMLDESPPSSKILKLPQAGVDGTPFPNVSSSGHSFLLPKGNYNLPFRVYLPADVPQTTEGLSSGSILYRVQCTIERGRFEKALHTSKPIRILRTLHPQSINLVDNIDIDNCWAGKVQYNVCLHKRGVAIGSTIPIKILVIPIAKGLTLKGVHACIVQHYNIEHEEAKSPIWEHFISKQSLKYSEDQLQLDSWHIKTHFKVTDQLKLLTPTCSIKNGMIQVKHRLRISVQLQNKDGHVSEVRANLPICVYISPNTGNVMGKHYYVDPQFNTFAIDKSKEDVVFERHEESENVSEEEEPQEDAPPLYQNYMYDKVYDINNPQSPMEQLRVQSAGNSPLGSSTNLQLGYFDIPVSMDAQLDSTNIDGLSEHLSSLDMRRSSIRTSLSPSGAATPKVSGAATPKSRGSAFDVTKLLEIPSYQQALEHGEDEDEPAPIYEGDDDDVGHETPTKNKKRHSHLHLNLLHKHK